MPASVAEIGAEAFCGCERLKLVTFKRRGRFRKALGNLLWTSLLRRAGARDCPFSPFGEDSSLRVIGRGAFRGCTSLKGIDLPDTVEEIR